MDTLNFNFPSKEFIEKNFEYVMEQLRNLNNKIDKQAVPKTHKYYRNKDLCEIFGLSNNTIASYREQGILPFTKLNGIFYYPVAEIDKILADNSNYNNAS